MILPFLLALTLPLLLAGTSWTKIDDGLCKQGAPYANLVPNPDLNLDPCRNLTLTFALSLTLVLSLIIVLGLTSAVILTLTLENSKPETVNHKS